MLGLQNTDSNQSRPKRASMRGAYTKSASGKLAEWVSLGGCELIVKICCSVAKG